MTAYFHLRGIMQNRSVNRLTQVLALVFFSCTLIACTYPYRPARVLDDGHIAVGVADALRTEGGGDVDALMIHGMCTHGTEWVRQSFDRLLTELGAAAGPPALSDRKSQSFGGVDLHVEKHVVGGRQLWLHAIVWSRMTEAAKQDLCFDRDDNTQEPDAAYCAKSPLRNVYERASLNGALKNKLLNDCLADAIVYVGSTGVAIRSGVKDAILAAVGSKAAQTGPVSLQAARLRAETETAPLFIISESLGSKVLFDSLLELSRSPSEAAVARTFERTAQIFMGANQIPILTLAGTTNPAALGEGPDPLDTLNRRYGNRSGLRFEAAPGGDASRQKPRALVVAFSDPNDLLSSPLRGSTVGRQPSYAFIDVIVSNAPTYFGYVELPDVAHRGYRTNAEVQRIIACGWPRSSRCAQ